MVRYSHPTSDWKILVVKTKDHQITVTGEFTEILQGGLCKFRGYWENHKDHGRQFKATDYEELLPKEHNQIIHYLSQRINGLGLMRSASLVGHFGDKTLEVIEKYHETMVVVPGINENLAKAISEQYKEVKHEAGIKVKLTGFGLTRHQVDVIYKKYGAEALDIFAANPYAMIYDLHGFGFKRVDLMALRSGYVKRNSKTRIIAGIEFVTNSFMPGKGHTYLPRKKFVMAAAKELEVDTSVVDERIPDVVARERIILEGDKVCNYELYLYENDIAEIMKGLIKNNRLLIKSDVPSDVLAPCRDKQGEAIQNSLSSPISVITGPPGSGKTWILKQIIACIERWNMTVKLAAPTGKAAKRMAESIDRKRECTTIHVLLEYNPEMGFGVNKLSPLHCNVLIIDELSMCDTELMYNLINACRSVQMIIFIGDVDQLPSVGPGKVMQAVMESPHIKTTRLDQIQRQAEGSDIIVNANRVNNGKQIHYEFKEGSDFTFIEKDEKEQIATCIPLIFHKAVKKYNFDPLTGIQILCPQKKGPIGAKALNDAMRLILNPKADLKDFSVNDKIIQIKNNYELGIFNGDTGVIRQINKKEKHYVIDFGYNHPTQYPFECKYQLQLAYALTIHKSQGSEFPMVIIPLHTTNWIMLQRNLLYTAITRGKEKVVIVGSKKAVRIAVRNSEPKRRYTRLEELLK